ncbi:MAG: sigma-70 family RNA polymerase sigma factor [Eubacterium sp.]|nr:sigma-70 family RNA polymerase sigma factor [Eubacterium sp.]
MQDKETENLVKKAKRRDPDAFTDLMQLCLKDMYRTALAILLNDEDAADAVGDTILACWEKLHTLKKPQYFKTWMTRILINNCYRIRRTAVNMGTLEEYEEPAVYDEYNLELKEALASLDEKYRIVMTLFYSEGYRIEEIASILKIPKSTVQTRLQRGRKKLARDYYGIRKGVQIL